MSIKYNEFGEVISVNGLTTGHHIGKPIQDAIAERPEHNEAYATERNTVSNAKNTLVDNQPVPQGGGVITKLSDLENDLFYETDRVLFDGNVTFNESGECEGLGSPIVINPFNTYEVFFDSIKTDSWITATENGDIALGIWVDDYQGEYYIDESGHFSAYDYVITGTHSLKIVCSEITQIDGKFISRNKYLGEFVDLLKLINGVIRAVATGNLLENGYTTTVKVKPSVWDELCSVLNSGNVGILSLYDQSLMTSRMEGWDTGAEISGMVNMAPLLKVYDNPKIATICDVSWRFDYDRESNDCTFTVSSKFYKWEIELNQ